MNDMRACYDRLLSAAAATANSVYEFSESLREMGDCLLEKTALNDDEESGKVLLMLGKVQFELQKLVDDYRSHIFQTITIPSESLLSELRIVEKMKMRCDGKWEIYEDLTKKHKEKGKLGSRKGECFSSHPLQLAHDEFDEEANIFIFRMKSLKQGQSRSLLTQASRHHAAQLCFFKKALRTLEAIEPHVKLVAEQHHIDYQFSGIKDDYGAEIIDDESDSDGDDNSEDGSETLDDGELSFDYGHNGPVQEVSTIENSVELDDTDAKFSLGPKLGAVKESFPRLHCGNSLSFIREVNAISKSAPLFPEKKLDPAERLTQMRPSPSRKFTSYVLPTPDEIKSPGSGKLESEVPQTKQATLNLWHTSPLDQNKYEKLRADEKLSRPIMLDTQSILKEHNKKASRFPPLLEGLSFKQFDPSVASDAKKVKRQAFSGPIIGEQWPNNPNLSASGSFVSSGYPPPFSGSLLHIPLSQPMLTTNLSSRTPATCVSSPKISELHELPFPPAHLAAKKLSNRITHSGSLVSRSHDLSTANVSAKSTAASTLPKPPQTISRSYSIPGGGPTEAAFHVPSEDSQNSKMAKDVSTL